MKNNDTSSNQTTNVDTDTLYAVPSNFIESFSFDQTVVDVFPDMIHRSVPGYSTIINMIGQLAERYAQHGTHCYDLGCSLGAATLAMRHRIVAADTKVISIDNSAAMIERCTQIIEADSGEVPVELRCENLEESELTNASVVVMNFTLQFVPIERRLEILKRISEALKPGGVLILSEKLHFDDEEHNNLMIELHHNFKRANGYSDLEIAQKRSALENILIPETIETHQTRLKEAGFRSTDLWFQCFNFSSLIAFK